LLQSFDEGSFSFDLRIMPANTLIALEPRKTPVQERAAATVQAIFEATIQVLLSHGADRLTTTRVADRAGVSVGTLYQYYPNKRALLFAAFEKHMEEVCAKVEAACAASQRRPLAEMIQQAVKAYVDVKMERADISVALFRVAADVSGHLVVKRATQRLRKALGAMLETAPDLQSPPDKFAVEVMLASISGAMRSALEAEASPPLMRKLREHLVLLCQAYMAAVTAPRN
jgi:AcrR family transcriptional regulator